MRLLLDSADISEVREFFPGITLAGVTTNPSLIAKQPQRDYLQLLQEIDNELETTGSDPQHFSVEVTTLDPEGMVREAMDLMEGLGKNVHVKIPLMPETLRVIEKLSRSNVKVNATACMTAIQAKLASDAGADVVSFFYNRMLDGYHGLDHAKTHALLPLEEIALYCSWGENATVICGSIRHPRDIVDCWQAGAYLVTAPAKVIKEALRHPKTVEAIGQFQRDIESWRR